MQIAEFYQQKKPILSLEIFPPKKSAEVEILYQTIYELTALEPDFISVTYGAGGGGGVEKTLAIAAQIKQDYGIETLHHLTCISSAKQEITQYLALIREQGVENILALRGDPPVDVTSNVPSEFTYAKDLIRTIKKNQNFCIGAACYPEGHIDCLDQEKDIQHMKDKEAAGADFFISQLFFQNDCFYHMLEQARRVGITSPISAGIMPILSRSQVAKMIFMCGASLPAELIKLINKYQYNSEDLQKAGLEYAIKQMDDLIAHGVDGIHIYTMNRSQIAQESLTQLRK